ncbi:NepR family anti-sigma factor [Erythrobacter sp.]|uniref:NepR family anti-sigma factor n=1 Tax=Erythrobacter sp. TaxID=1042 RepID=UPI003C71702F
MSEKKQQERVGDEGRSGDGENAPEWTSGLRQLYDSVVKEPLPDTFQDLLDQLDDDSGNKGAGEPQAANEPRGAGHTGKAAAPSRGETPS